MIRATGATVEQRRIVDDKLDVNWPRCEFVCSSSDGASVIVRFGHAENIKPDGLVAILQPASKSWWKIRAEGRLMKQIEAALRKHGAVEVSE